jgi:tripartite-type tricarboxylate transporter receptor subunit TctC
MRYLRAVLAAAVLALASFSAAAAQSYPSRPVTIVIGFPPGGAIDTIARLMAPQMSESLGQPIVIENKPGAGGAIGAAYVARARPDGYTIFMGTMGNFSISPSLIANLPYDVQKQFAPVTLVAASGFVLYVNPKLPVANVKELIAYGKAHPGHLNFSSSGNGGLPHMAGEMFNSATGLKMTHVPYKGSSPSISGLVAGQVQLTFEAPAIGIPFVKSGKLRALATTGTKPLPALPDVPTVAQTVPGFVISNWFGMAVPKGTPPAVIERIQQEVSKAVHQPAAAAKLEALGVEPVGNTPAEFGKYMREETRRWAGVIKSAGITME